MRGNIIHLRMRLALGKLSETKMLRELCLLIQFYLFHNFLKNINVKSGKVGNFGEAKVLLWKTYPLR